MGDANAGIKWNREEMIVIAIDVGTTQSEFSALTAGIERSWIKKTYQMKTGTAPLVFRRNLLRNSIF
jgi:hypothetical protein